MTKYFAVPYRVRRFWLAAIGVVCLGVLIGSLVGDLWFGTNTTSNVYLPVTGLLGGSFLSYVWSRKVDDDREERKDADVKPSP